MGTAVKEKIIYAGVTGCVWLMILQDMTFRSIVVDYLNYLVPIYQLESMERPPLL